MILVMIPDGDGMGRQHLMRHVVKGHRGIGGIGIEVIVRVLRRRGDARGGRRRRRRRQVGHASAARAATDDAVPRRRRRQAYGGAPDLAIVVCQHAVKVHGGLGGRGGGDLGVALRHVARRRPAVVEVQAVRVVRVDRRLLLLFRRGGGGGGEVEVLGWAVVVRVQHVRGHRGRRRDALVHRVVVVRSVMGGRRRPGEVVIGLAGRIPRERDVWMGRRDRTSRRGVANRRIEVGGVLLLVCARHLMEGVDGIEGRYHRRRRLLLLMLHRPLHGGSGHGVTERIIDEFRLIVGRQRHDLLSERILLCRHLLRRRSQRQRNGAEQFVVGAECDTLQAHFVRVRNELCLVLLEYLRQYAQAEIDLEQELRLEVVHLLDEHPPDLGVVRVVVIRVVEEFGGQENGRDDDSVDVELGEEEVVTLDEPIDVDEREDEAFLGA